MKHIYEKIGNIFEQSTFLGACDRLRRTPEGEAFWQKMMKTRTPISEQEFIENVNVSDILDDDETWDSYRDEAEQEDAIDYFKSSNGVYFLQTAGFEFIWQGER